MVKKIVSNVTGVFVYNNERVIEKTPFTSLKEYGDRKKVEKKYLDKYAVVKEILHYVDKNTFDIESLRNINILLTKKQIRDSVHDDQLIIQAINTIDDITKVSNSLCKRLREWFSLYLPELDHSVGNNETFVKLVLEKDRKNMIKDLHLHEFNIMGGELSKEDITAILNLAEEIQRFYQLKTNEEDYLNRVLKKRAPNTFSVCGGLITAQLLRQSGGLEKLSKMPSSTIQLLGAEKALFRHLKQKARCPKQGLIINHPLLANAKASLRGKISRHLAGAISIAAKVDFFKGDIKTGEKLLKELEKKLKIEKQKGADND